LKSAAYLLVPTYAAAAARASTALSATEPGLDISAEAATAVEEKMEVE
jgi:hypothetical protein